MSAPGFGHTAEDLRRSTLEVLAANGAACGSAVVLGPGRALTNAHVLQGVPGKIRVRRWTGDVLDAAIERQHGHRDLTLLRVPELNETPVALRDSTTVRAGEIAIAMGNPMGFIGALSTGVVRGIGPVRGLGRRSWIQADVRLAPGNSGGPLADVRGRLIGVNTMVYGGLGLAIPSSAIQHFLSGKQPFQLGVTVREVRLRDGLRGVLILEVEPTSPAQYASLLAGDVITGIDAAVVRDADDLAEALQDAGPLVQVRFVRGGNPVVRQTTARAPVSAETAA